MPVTTTSLSGDTFVRPITVADRFDPALRIAPGRHRWVLIDAEGTLVDADGFRTRSAARNFAHLWNTEGEHA